MDPLPPDPTVPLSAPVDAPLTPSEYLFYLCAIYSVVIWFQIVHDFIKQNEANAQAGYPVEGYMLLLGIYAGLKAIKRASGQATPDAEDQRLIKGEWFIALWAITWLVVGLIAHEKWHGMMDFPRDLQTAFFGMGTIFAGTSAHKYIAGKKLSGSVALPGTSHGRIPPAETPEPTETGGTESTPPANQQFIDEMYAFLETRSDGCTRAELEDHFHAKRDKIMSALNPLIEQGKVVRVGKPGDPKTRYMLAEFQDLKEFPGPPLGRT